MAATFVCHTSVHVHNSNLTAQCAWRRLALPPLSRATLSRALGRTSALPPPLTTCGFTTRPREAHAGRYRIHARDRWSRGATGRAMGDRRCCRGVQRMERAPWCRCSRACEGKRAARIRGERNEVRLLVGQPSAGFSHTLRVQVAPKRYS